MTSQYVIANGRIYVEAQVIEKGYFVAENGKISGTQKGDYKGHLNQIDIAGKHMLPGFIDIYVHGGYGEDAMDASYDGLNHLAKQLSSEGTATFLAATMTQSDESIEKALRNIVACYENQTLGEAAEISGVHLEEPFIPEHKVGVQDPKYVQRPTVGKIRHFQEVAKGSIKIITLAPEVEGVRDMLSELRDEIIFSMGHTAVTFEEANEAVERGAKHVMHLYSVAIPLEHYSLGVFGAAWTNQSSNTEIIGDGIYSHPVAVDTAYK